jgi:hypothetical protein
MLGANGQSNGCVSFSDYPEFLNAFLRGEVTRLVVVERLESPPGKFAVGQLPDRDRGELKADRSFQYAAASYWRSTQGLSRGGELANPKEVRPSQGGDGGWSISIGPKYGAIAENIKRYCRLLATELTDLERR